uniref:Uncharacterized protein n=1 Tax=Octopus bimaculoides TaxID=37653 RepID=A0A0L8FM81_OCTBM
MRRGDVVQCLKRRKFLCSFDRHATPVLTFDLSSFKHSSVLRLLPLLGVGVGVSSVVSISIMDIIENVNLSITCVADISKSIKINKREYEYQYANVRLRRWAANLVAFVLVERVGRGNCRYDRGYHQCWRGFLVGEERNKHTHTHTHTQRNKHAHTAH